MSKERTTQEIRITSEGTRYKRCLATKDDTSASYQVWNGLQPLLQRREELELIEHA